MVEVSVRVVPVVEATQETIALPSQAAICDALHPEYALHSEHPGKGSGQLAKAP
jgi:hypothetical protein